jgi:protein-L-isoaspartate(D-aspartate) O-methyltransferase
MNKDAIISQLKKQGFSEKIIDAFSKVKRENFIPDRFAGYAYEDMALPIEEGTTISQPSTIAFMLNLLDLKQNQKILEIGSGTGYALALMSEIIKDGRIYGIELNKHLAVKSKKLLSNDSNIEVLSMNGFNGLPQFAPFDRILISATSSVKPTHLYSQLSDSGIIVFPVKQSIFQIKKENGKITEKEFPGFVFVPLLRDEEGNI